MKPRNFVAKHAKTVHRSSVHIDKKKSYKTGSRKIKHKGSHRNDGCSRSDSVKSSFLCKFLLTCAHTFRDRELLMRKLILFFALSAFTPSLLLAMDDQHIVTGDQPVSLFKNSKREVVMKVPAGATVNVLSNGGELSLVNYFRDPSIPNSEVKGYIKSERLKKKWEDIGICTDEEYIDYCISYSTPNLYCESYGDDIVDFCSASVSYSVASDYNGFFLRGFDNIKEADVDLQCSLTIRYDSKDPVTMMFDKARNWVEIHREGLLVKTRESTGGTGTFYYQFRPDQKITGARIIDSACYLDVLSQRT